MSEHQILSIIKLECLSVYRAFIYAALQLGSYEAAERLLILKGGFSLSDIKYAKRLERFIKNRRTKTKN